jgi:hypothetical protein
MQYFDYLPQEEEQQSKMFWSFCIIIIIYIFLITFKLFRGHWFVGLGVILVVLVDVQHDDAVAQGESGITVGKLIIVAFLPVIGKMLQDYLNQGGLAGEPENEKFHSILCRLKAELFGRPSPSPRDFSEVRVRKFRKFRTLKTLRTRT